nr:hypothetical protein [Tanacetum cinerariifolium]
MTESSLMDSDFAIHVFSPRDDLIACLNKAMAFLIAIASLRFPSTNNQLRTSLNLRNQATIQDGRVTVQQVQGRQRQSYSGNGYKSNTTSFRGNNATRLAKAQEARKNLDEEQLAFLADPGVPDGQSVQTIIPHNATFQTEDLDTYDSDCDDVSNAKAVLMAKISNYDSDVISEPQAFYDNIHKQALGYQNPFYLKKAQQIKPTLYDGIVICAKHVAMHVIDDKETLILEEESQSKVSEKENDPEAIKRKNSNKPIDYVKLNKLYEDFRKCFVPQQELSSDEAFWYHMLNPSTKSSVALPVKIEAPKELLKSMFLNDEYVNMERKRNESYDKCFNLDDELLKSQNAHNDILKRIAHIDYLKYTQEQADILRGIVEQAKAKQPLDNALDFACHAFTEVGLKWKPTGKTFTIVGCGDCSLRPREELESEKSKKQKLDENVQAKVADDYTTELKICMEIVPEDDDEVTIEATPLSSKSLTILNYKIYKEGKQNYFKIIRKCMVRFGKNGKIAPRFVGAFKIIERIGLVAYRYGLEDILEDKLSTITPLKTLVLKVVLLCSTKRIMCHGHLIFSDDELSDKELKQIEVDDQAIQTILLGLPEDIYAAVDSCKTTQEIWLRVQQMMKGSNIEIQEKKAKLFNEWERFTFNEGESIESYYHRFLKLMNDLKRNKHFLEKIASNLKFLNNLQPEWSRHVTIVYQTKDLHTADYTQLYNFLKYNQKEVDELKAERIAKSQDPLALMENSNNPYVFPAPHQDQSSFNQNYLQQPMLNPEDITDPTTAMNMALALMSNAFKLNYSTPTNNNQRISSNPRNRQIAQPENGNQNQIGNGNIVAAHAEGNIDRQNGNQIRCYNCRGVEEYDLMAAAADLDEIEEVNGNCILMANLQQASTLGTRTDSAPVYDTDGSAE